MGNSKGKIIGALIGVGVAGVGGVAGGIALSQNYHAEKITQAEEKGYNDGYEDGLQVNIGYTEEELEQAKNQAKEEGKQEGYEQGFDDGKNFEPTYSISSTNPKFLEKYNSYKLNNDIFINFEVSRTISLFKNNNFVQEIELCQNVDTLFNAILLDNKYLISFMANDGKVYIIEASIEGELLNTVYTGFSNIELFLIEINSKAFAYQRNSSTKKVMNLYEINSQLNLNLIVLPEGKNLNHIQLDKIYYTEYGYFFTGKGSCYYLSLDYLNFIEFSLPAGSIYESFFYQLGTKNLLIFKTNSSSTGMYYKVMTNEEDIGSSEIKKIILKNVDGSINDSKMYFCKDLNIVKIDDNSFIFYGGKSKESPLYLNLSTNEFIYNYCISSNLRLIHNDDKYLIFTGKENDVGYGFELFDKVQKKFIFGRKFSNTYVGDFESMNEIEGGYLFHLTKCVIKYQNETISSLSFKYKKDNKYYVLKDSNLSLYDTYTIENNEFVKGEIVFMKV